MNTDQRLAVRTVLSGMLALAVALGIGRFALTPLLPLMQQDAGLSLAAGSSLASANYLGYLIGALLAVRSSHSRQHWNWFALFCIAASTAAMALSRQLQIWLILRLLAGIASAWALIFTTAHVQHHMARHDWAYAGWLFGGVGLGIIGSGLICLALAGHLASWQIWLVLGLICLILVGLAGSSSQALRVNLWLAATALLMGAVLLWLPGARSSRTVLG